MVCTELLIKFLIILIIDLLIIPLSQSFHQTFMSQTEIEKNAEDIHQSHTASLNSHNYAIIYYRLLILFWRSPMTDLHPSKVNKIKETLLLSH